MQLSEGGNVVNTGVGAGVGEYHQSLANENAAAISHDWSLRAGTLQHIRRVVGASLLVNLNGNSQFLSTTAVMRAANRDGSQSIKPDGDADVGFGGANAFHRIKADPTKFRYIRLGPRVARALLNAVNAQIAGDKTCRDRETAGGPDENVRQVARSAALALKHFGGGRSFCLRRLVLASHLLV